MKLIIVGQDKRTIWDYNRCLIAIADDLRSIIIKPYENENSVLLAQYSDPERTDQVFNELINVFSKPKAIIKAKMPMKINDLEKAKYRYEALNGEKLTMIDEPFEVVPLNNTSIIYQFPPDEVKI